MQKHYVRKDGKEVNIFYCDYLLCLRRTFVLFDPDIHTGKLDVHGWGVVFVENDKGETIDRDIYCPFHWEEYKRLHD